jgi:hypothetical protein
VYPIVGGAKIIPIVIGTLAGMKKVILNGIAIGYSVSG